MAAVSRNFVLCMMKPFDLDLLFLPGFLIFIVTWCVAFYVTRSVVFSLPAAFLKAGIFLIYFGFLFDGTFTFLDDWRYVAGGMALLNEGIGLSNLAENWGFVLMTGGGDHFLYHLYNAYAFRFFGIGYYAPVALNILLTVLVAWTGSILGAKEFGLIGQWRKIFFMFLLFQPDILAWSNVMNGKDIFVLSLHVLLLFAVSLYFQGRINLACAIAVPIVAILLFLRFYVPLLFSVVFVIHQLLAVKRLHHVIWFIGTTSLLLLGAVMTVGNLMASAWANLLQDIGNPFFGFLRMTLIPIPFNTELNYGFLDIPALFHWILMPMVIYGLISLVSQKKNTPFIKFFLIYLAVFMMLYSVYGELQGPRHRVQLDFAWTVLQFIGIKRGLVWSLTLRRQSQPALAYKKAIISNKPFDGV